MALAAIILGSAWALTREPPPLGSCRLPDGTVLRLEAVTYGPRHRVVFGRYWQRLLAPVLPPGLQPLLGDTTRDYAGPSPNSIGFWASRSPRVPSNFNVFRAVVFDEHGCEYECRTGYSDALAGVLGWSSEVFPRRGKRVGLRLYQLGIPAPSAPVAEFTVPNPAPGPYPTWKAEPLPATKQDGSLAVILTSLRTALRYPSGPDLTPSAPGEQHWTRASFHISQDGRPTQDWQPVGVTLADATGNTLGREGMVQYESDGVSHFAFDSDLCVEEPAWKLRVEFTRIAGHAPDDLWTVRGVPVPKRRAIIRSEAAATRHGVGLHLLGIAGAGARMPESGLGSGDTPIVHVQVSSPLDGLRLRLVRAIDDRGSEAAAVGSGILENQQFGVLLQIPPGAKSLDLTFAVSKSRFVEYVVKPAQAERSAHHG